METYQVGWPSLYRWKLPHLIKGTLTWVPVVNAWRMHRAATGGSDSPRYCYSVWLRHLVMLYKHGFKICGARIGELGPGDSIGIGLAALLSGADQYVGLDIVPFSLRSDLELVFHELVQLYSQKAFIPDDKEFPGIRPKLSSYEFPSQLLQRTNFVGRAENIRRELKRRLLNIKGGVNGGSFVVYKAPWTSPEDITVESLDLVFSQAVLEHVDDLEETYRAMSRWLKPGGYASHVIDFSAHQLSPHWNGHWAYGDSEWRLVRGRREFLLNRAPLTTHLDYARRSGLNIVVVSRAYDDKGLPKRLLAPRFQKLDAEDSRTRGAVLLLRKGN